MSSLDINTKLLKLHMAWPARKLHAAANTEAVEFFKYLFLNYHDLDEVQALKSVADAAQFIEQNARVLYAKSTRKQPLGIDPRIEPRVVNKYEVVLSTQKFAQDVEMMAMTANGNTLDIALHGVCVELDKVLPEASILTLLLKMDDDRKFELAAETCWVRPLEAGQLMGLKIVESLNFALWRDHYKSLKNQSLFD
ncbi:MAG: PilZ domain-containing protein [Pseudomonadales bacterium]|nr:PilZ domain-containing protein [Pseudomonadales bacterium]